MAAFSLPIDYAERVYAGVLGKMIGVYLGRPFEGWTYEKIMAELGEINYYVHDKLGAPLIVTDDDLSGTFTFLRALADHGYTPDLTSEQIGQTWLNYIIEMRTILWWGGLGNSTEHTAYLRLKHGIKAPRSGSSELNSRLLAEQIGAQIFIDGWAMVAPGNPTLAVKLAGQAAHVSHDGEAVYAAQLLAAMEAQAFIEKDIQSLIDTGLSFIPEDSLIHHLIQDIRVWHKTEPDWRKTREQIARKYGYDSYGGNCHVVPNHALIILALLYGEDQFQKSLRIANTSGWDTDCNSGNVGCLLGIKNGLAGLDDGPDWRGPLADRLYLPTADGGRAVTDALTEAYHIVETSSMLAGEVYIPPEGGRRFHFSLPGAVQGFRLIRDDETPTDVRLENTELRPGTRSLTLYFDNLLPGQHVRASTSTFIPPEAKDMPNYGLLASPTLHAGQVVQATFAASAANTATVTTRLFVNIYDGDDQIVTVRGPALSLSPGEESEAVWRVPDTVGLPIAAIGIEVSTSELAKGGVYLESLGWEGSPKVTFTRPAGDGRMWHSAWVDGVDQFERRFPEPYRLVQNDGRGMVMQGTREWRDYEVSAVLTPHMVDQIGLGVRVQGLWRYYAVMLAKEGRARLVKMRDEEKLLGQAEIFWELERAYTLRMQVMGAHIQAWLDGELLFDVSDDESDTVLAGGGVALICREGCMGGDEVAVRPIS